MKYKQKQNGFSLAKNMDYLTTESDPQQIPFFMSKPTAASC